MASQETLIRPEGKWLSFDFREILDHKELLYFFVWRDLKVRYRQTLIGVAWVVLQPLLTMAIFSVVFGKLARLPSDGLPYPLFYYSGLLPWIYFSGAVQTATGVMIENQRLITKVYFPRVLLPLSAVLSGLVDLLISSSILLVLILYYGIPLQGRISFLLVFGFLAVASALGCGLFLSALNALYRDVRYAVPFLLQIWLFISPVAYSTSLVPARWQALYHINPMALVVEGFRWGLLPGKGGWNYPVALSLLSIFFFLFFGLAYFQRVEKNVADHI